MLLAAWIFAALAAALHAVFFVVESLLWTRPAVRERFGQSKAAAETTKVLAFNQGFYNLFLGAGVGVSGVLAAHGHPGAELVALWCLASMVGAALVLVMSSLQMYRGALIQGVPAAVAFGLFLAARG